MVEVGSIGEAREDWDGFEKREDKREIMGGRGKTNKGKLKGQRDRDGFEGFNVASRLP